MQNIPLLEGSALSAVRLRVWYGRLADPSGLLPVFGVPRRKSALNFPPVVARRFFEL
jgi:hypothetical protein